MKIFDISNEINEDNNKTTVKDEEGLILNLAKEYNNSYFNNEQAYKLDDNELYDRIDEFLQSNYKIKLNHITNGSQINKLIKNNDGLNDINNISFLMFLNSLKNKQLENKQREYQQNKELEYNNQQYYNRDTDMDGIPDYIDMHPLQNDFIDSDGDGMKDVNDPRPYYNDLER
ncbi:MAG: hypothetical protein ACLURU_00710 [Finegoldia magna]|nr:hypothetical protein [Finegoldia magna]